MALPAEVGGGLVVVVVGWTWFEVGVEMGRWVGVEERREREV